MISALLLIVSFRQIQQLLMIMSSCLEDFNYDIILIQIIINFSCLVYFHYIHISAFNYNNLHRELQNENLMV